MRYKAILFDMDGTLLDTLADMVSAVNHILSAPGMWMQNFTTNEPDDSMIEVAIEAMKLVIPAEQGKDQW